MEISTDATGMNHEEVSKILETLKESNPTAVQQIENYIKSIEANLHSFSSPESGSLNDYEQLKLFNNVYSQSAILLKKSPESSNQLLSWIIEMANPATNEVLGTNAENCIGHKLSDFIEATYSITVPDEIDEYYTDTFEVDIPEMFKYLVITVKGKNDGKLTCCISDQSECYMLRNELNRHLQRFELITESIIISSSKNSYDDVFKMILERVGFHISPKRILVFIDNDQKGELKYQHTASGFDPIARYTSINHKECESWNKMLCERKMILGFSLNHLPSDIANILGNLGIHNAYIFPLADNDKTYGSMLLETMEGNALDNFEINYLQTIGTLLAGHINNKLITDDLIKEKERAQEADQLKSSFLVNMSHDIRIPINTILGFSDLLADEDLTQTDREEFIDMINNSGNDLITLFDNIIDISKIETGQITINKSLCAIDALMKDIMAMYKHNRKLEGNDELELVLDLPEKFAKSKIDTDIFKFRQICTNLIDNAIKFTDCGTVKFGISNSTDDKLEFYVQDTGIGIAEEAQSMIFQRFSKVDRTFAKKYNGTGLGLSICKSLVEMLGGEIYVVSALGKGSTFYFTLPFKEVQKANETTERESKSPYNWEKRSIVIVDNIEQDKKYLNYILANTGINIIWFNSGDETLNFFDEGNMADIMLVETTDSTMDAVSKIHNEHPIRIIAMSSEQMPDKERTFALKSGCDEIVSKPLDLQTFLRTIDNLMAKK